jgi:L,D-transpeptidase ErfK/SrfK
MIQEACLCLRVGRVLAIAACLFGLAMLGPAAANVYRLPNPSDGVVGHAFYVKARYRDTLLDIGRHNGLGYDDMKDANPGVDVWLPGAGTEVLVPDEFVLPDAPRVGVVINLAEKRIYYYPPGSGQVQTFAIGGGGVGWGTPLGTFRITQKIKGPAWVPPASIRAEHLASGDPRLPAVVPAGPDNPLGAYALRLSVPGYLIHGTNKPWGVGMRVSHGCIRLYPEGIEQLFGEVGVNTAVTIVNQPFKVGWRGNDLYLEVHATAQDKTTSLTDVIPPAIANARGVRVDWGAVRRAVLDNTGLPLLVGGRQGSVDPLYLRMIF